MTPIKVKSSYTDQSDKKKRMAKYPAATEGFSEEKKPYRFINDVWQKGSYQEEPYIYAASQESK